MSSADARQLVSRVTQKQATLCTVGFICAQAWLPLISMVANFYRVGIFSEGSIAPLALSFLTSFAVISAICAFSRPIRSHVSKHRASLIVVGFLCVCLGAIFQVLFDYALPNSKVILILVLCGIFEGVGNTLLLVSWVQLAQELGLPLRRYAVGIAAGNCMVATIPQIVRVQNDMLLLFPLLTTVMVSVSMVCWLLLNSRGKGYAADQDVCQTGGDSRSIWPLACSCACYGMLFSCMSLQFLNGDFGEASSFTWVFAIVGICCAAAALAVSKLFGAKCASVTAWRIALIPTVIALFPLEEGTDFSLKFALCFITLALWYVLALTPFVAIDFAQRKFVPLNRMASAAWAGLASGAALGVLVAWIAGLFVEHMEGFTKVSGLCAIIAAFLGSLLLSANHDEATAKPLWRFRTAENAVDHRFASADICDSMNRSDSRPFASSTNSQGDAPDSPPTGSFSASILHVAQTYGLTTRESDVLALLARGHSLRHIGEELCISEGTTITHRQHIYRKLGVHSKQELIDLVASIK